MVSPILDKQCDTTTFLYSFATSTIKLEHKNYLYPRAKTNYDVEVFYLLICYPLQLHSTSIFNVRLFPYHHYLAMNILFVLPLIFHEAFSITIDQYLTSLSRST